MNSIKMENPNRPGKVKMFNPSDVELAKSNGWKELDKPKAKASKKSKGGK